jgi:transcriptional regulator with XRE-family HTH domain
MGSNSGDISIGERLRFYRQAQYKTQAVTAGLAEVTEDYLSQIERGLKTPTVGVLQRLAAVLGLPVSVLLGEPSYASESVIHPVAPAIQAALMSYGHAPDTEPEPLASLQARVQAAWTIWQTAPLRYTGAAALLPALTADVQHAVRAARGNAPLSRQAAQVSADLYFLLRTFTKRIGRPDLSLLAADRAMAAAQDAEDPLRVLGAEWNLGQILLTQGQVEAAMDVAVRSAERLEPTLAGCDDDRLAALCGAQWLNAATAAVRLRQPWIARDILRDHADPIARRIDDASNVMWTVFGPTNVQMHAVSIELETGESREALRIAERIDASRSPSLERRTTLYLQLAACYEQRRDDMGVLVHLQGAQETGPEDLRFNLVARDLARSLLRRSRASIAVQTTRLAAEMGLLDPRPGPRGNPD